MIFEGKRDAEIFHENSEWVSWVTNIFLPIIDSESGDFRSLPFEGTIMDQPCCTMNILKLIQHNFRLVIDKKEKEAVKASRRR